MCIPLHRHFYIVLQVLFEKHSLKIKHLRISHIFQLDFLNNLSPDVLVLSLCAYYALAHGMFDEFEDLHDRYVEKAESLKELRVFDLPARRWE